MRSIGIVWIIVMGAYVAGSVRPADRRLSISDTIGRAWMHEPIYWDVALRPGESKGASVRIECDGKPIPAQIVVTERHPDGSAKAACITFIVDRLEGDASTTVTAQLDRTGPTETDLSVQKGEGYLVLANRFTAVKVLNWNGAGGKESEFSPILGVRTTSGKWTDAGRYATQTTRPVGTRTELLEAGPVRLAARVTTRFDNGRTHGVTV